ncbi:MAG: ribosome-binding factor A [Firmicutes bacterium HGW-Firmicutes-1]|jgi:ribosome-binding factor A|nr:MAG: ribosome-binding factor A [Firmicutes bacterium HGW-Firmicutes-1]
MRKANNRITRINEEIKHELSNIIRTGLKDPRVTPLASVLRVETTPDLKHCKIFISVLGNEEVRKSTEEGLKSSSGYIKGELARKVNLRLTPELHFVMDQSIEYGINMSKLIDDVINNEGQEK